MIEMTARDFAAFLREWETPLRRELATAKSMGQTEHEGNQRLSAKLGEAEKRIAELEKLERERVALFKRKDAHISKQAERIAELERQTNQYDQAVKDELALQSALKLQVSSLERNLQAARAEVSKEREAARVLAERLEAYKRPGPQVGGPFPLMKGDILGDGEYAEIQSPKAIEDFGWATVVWRKGQAVWVKA